MRSYSLDEAAEHALAALRLSRSAKSLAGIRADILKSVEIFLAEFAAIADSPLWDLSKHAQQQHSKLSAQLHAAANELRNKPLDWFAAHHDWNTNHEKSPTECAAFLLKQIGRIGKGYRP